MEVGMRVGLALMSSMACLTISSPPAVAEPLHKIAEIDLDGDGKLDSLEVGSLAGVTGSFGAPYALRGKPGIADMAAKMAAIPGFAGVLIRLAAEPDRPYLVMGADEAVVKGWKVEVRPPGEYRLLEGGSKSFALPVVVITGSDSCLAKVWNARQGDFFGARLAD
jgi:hypothetical protein